MRRRTVLLVAPGAQGLPLTQGAVAQASPHHTVQVVCDGETALAYLLREGAYTDPCQAPAPDLMVLDLPLPRLSGLEVVRCLKQDPRFKQLPIIVLAPAGRTEDMSQAYAAGVNAYVQKPRELVRFLNLIGQLGQFWLETAELPPPLALEASARGGTLSTTQAVCGGCGGPPRGPRPCDT
jgi:CheY-like chemotaxis protein